jgi:hypothetical protein
MNSYLPATPGTNPKQYAVLDAIRFPRDPANVVLEDNHVVFKFRSDSPSIVSGAEAALFDNQNSGAYIGNLFDLTSKRIGFLGRGFGSPSIAKTLGPNNIASFETLPGVTDQCRPAASPPAAPCTFPTRTWTSTSGTAVSPTPTRVKRMFSPRTAVPSDPNTVTIANGPAQVSTMAQAKQDATGSRLLGHNALLQQAARLGSTVYDNYGRRWPQGTSVPLREDFNTLDDPFAWAPGGVGPTNKPGMRFVAFVPAIICSIAPGWPWIRCGLPQVRAGPGPHTFAEASTARHCQGSL